MNLKDTLSDAEVVAYWRFLQEEFVSVALRVPGMRSIKLYSVARRGVLLLRVPNMHEFTVRLDGSLGERCVFVLLHHKE